MNATFFLTATHFYVYITLLNICFSFSFDGGIIVVHEITNQ